MAHTHAHSCSHGGAHHHEDPALGWALVLTALVLVVLLWGGYASNSLALWADAGHVVTDFAALGLSWYALRQAQRPAHPLRSFGYHRTGILVAVINALSLVLIAVVIGYEAWARLFTPEPVKSTVMLASAGVGLVVNLVIGHRLHGHHHHSLNVRSAYLHVLGDALASLGVIVGAIIMAFTQWWWVDPLLSVGIALLIAYGAYQVLDESVVILMEGTPTGVDPLAVREGLLAVDGVQDVHELHIWSIAQHLPSLSAHVVIADDQVPHSLSIIAACNTLLSERFGITHTTIQAEAAHCLSEESDCNLALVQPRHSAHHHDHHHEDHHPCTS